MELIDLVNSTIFLLRGLTFLLGSLTVTLIVLLFWISDFQISSVASICSTTAFPTLGNSDHVVVSVSIDFTSYSKQDAPFHHIVHDHSHTDWNGLCDHLREVQWNDIFKLCASAAASEFCVWIQVGIDVIFLIISIRSSLTHLHRFQLLVLLP